MSLTYLESLCFRNGPYHQCSFKIKKLSLSKLRFLSQGERMDRNQNPTNKTVSQISNLEKRTLNGMDTGREFSPETLKLMYRFRKSIAAGTKEGR